MQAGPGRKTPYYFPLKDGGPFAFAGLWERWQKGEEPIESCSLITTEANGVVGPMYDPETEPNALKAMLSPLPDDWLTAHPVSKLVNNPRNESPRCIEPVSERGRKSGKAGIAFARPASLAFTFTDSSRRFIRTPRQSARRLPRGR